MAGAISHAKLKVSADGTEGVAKKLDQVGKATAGVGRAQTRLGQASASAGRQFSAQASGLGGLVAAYAGAAATIFAITAAFGALNNAARAEQTITGVNALANAIGESGPKIIKGLQEITKGQLSIVQTAELANLALSSGFSADQINNLAEISLKASRALGRDLTDSFNRLVRGVTKLEPELLDELGIFTRLDPAVEAYAKSLGKTVGSLSNFERRQAFANEVAKEGTEKFKDIDTSANTSAESLEKLSATLSDIGTNVGGFIARALAPLAEALSNPIAAIGAFGILAKTVFGTTFRELGAGLERFEGRLESLSGTIVDKLGGSSKAAAKANEALGASLTDVNMKSARVSATFDQEFRSLIAKGRAQQLSFAETTRLNSAIKQEIVLLENEKASIASSSMSQKVKENRTGILSRRLIELNKVLGSTKTRLDSTSKSAQFAARSFAVVSGAAVKFGKGLLSIFNALTLVITVASVFTTFGAIFLEAFGWLEPTISFVKSLVREFRVLLGIQKEAIAQSEVARELSKAAEGTAPIAINNPLTSGVAISSAQIVESTAAALKAGATGSAAEFADAFIEDLPTKLKSQMRGRGGAAARQEIEAIFNSLFGDLAGLGPGALQGISEFADATGRTLKTVTQQLALAGEGLQFKGIEKLPGTLASVNAQFKDSSDLTGEALKNANAFNKTQLDILQSQEVAVNLQEALTSGAANAEQIEKRRSAVLAKIANLRKSEAESDKETARKLENTFRLQDQNAQAQLAVLKERDKLLKTFSAEIKAAEKLNEIFTLIADGENTRVELGITSNDKARNRIKILQEDFKLGKDALAQERAGLPISALQAQRASLARDAQKALVGVFVKTNDEARKLADTLEKISKTLTAQAKKAEDAFAVEQIKRARQLSEQIATSTKAQIDRTEKLRQATQKLADARSKAGEAGRKLGQKLEGDLAGQTFQTDQDKRALILKFAKEDLNALKAITATQVINIQARADAEREKLEADILNLERQGAGVTDRESLIQKEFDQRKKLEQTALATQKQLKIDEIDLLEQRKKGIIDEAIAFSDHIEGIRDVLAADIVARKEVTEGDDFVKNTVAALDKSGRFMDARRLEETGDVAVARAARVDLGKGNAQMVAQKGLDDLIERLQTTDFESLKKQVDAAFKAEEDLASLRRDVAYDNEILAAEEKLATARSNLAALGINTKAEIEALNLALQNAGRSFSSLSVVTRGASDNFKTALKGSLEIVQGGLTQGFLDFNNALVAGNLTFKNISRGFRDMVGDMLRAIQQQVFTDTIAKPASNFIMKMIGFSQGGPAHMAGGGSMKRDRIPAMLEPGEFVIRKEAAKMIGLSKLQQMNSGNADIFKMLGMNPVKKVGGGPAGSAGMSGSGDHSGTSAAGIGGGGGDGSDISVGFARDFLAKHPDANIFADSTMTAMALSSMGRRFGMSGAIDPRNALDIERKIDYAKGSANVRGEDFNLEQAYKKANTGFFGRTINAIAPKTPMDMVSLLLAGAGGPLGKGISRVRSGIQIGTKAALFGEEIESLGLQGALEQEERFRMQQAAGGSIRHMAGGGSVNTRDRVPALLEPGEFVIRRPMAKAIGGQALSQMNSTGRPPQISVNLNNSGAPKSVNVQPPKMNGDKIILDIITRDMRNNGSMRKALRRGK